MTNRGPERDTNPGMNRPQQQFPQQSQQRPQQPPQSQGQFGSGQPSYGFGQGQRPQQPQQDQPQYPYRANYSQAAGAQPNRGSNKGLIIGLVIGIVALLVAVAALLAWNMGVFDRSSNSAPPTVVEVVTETAEDSATNGTDSLAREPGGASSEPQRSEPTQSAPAPTSEQDRPRGSDYTSYSAATSVTSDKFARAVAIAFQEHVDRTGTTNGTISAHSPVTGQTYSMNCVDLGSYVSCSGGNNAVVHIS